ncbi:PEP-CTERM sorting domain-containing protein [Nitrosococcus watsonii]|uniref:Uncharacterized protein n=1 Tax=Nitrosococcus watsoni (strain C-113) TaxID=105559 RepID=D8K6P7_NITWC|nr:PEP-CTERM sorting domain-containing protein [Nitrosococcus watsonii]ADJ28574.1 protein of unknown function DUF1555 [Nitrosococcus watsonii C-113]
MFRNRLKTTTNLVLATGISMMAFGTHATVITNGYVFPDAAITPTGTSQINVGYGGASGELEVNGGGTGNGFTAIGGSGLLVGAGAGSTGGVRIIGNGISGSATATINNGIGARIGLGGTGALEVRQGGVLESNADIHLGESFSGSTGTSNVTIDGAGSVLRSQTASGSFAGGGRILVPFGAASSTLTVSNGGLVDAVGGQLSEFEQGAVFIGDYSEATAANVNVTVTGEGSTIQAQHGIFVENQFGQAVVNITDGGAVKQLEPGFVFDGKQEPGIIIDSLDANGAQVNVSGISASGVASSLSAVTDIDIGIEVSQGKSTGHLLVENGGKVTTLTDINISSNNSDPRVTSVSGQDSSLTVRNGGMATAQNVFVNADGRLSGDGTITGNVIVDGGTVAPGNSPGTMTIDGDFIVNGGTLELEIDSLFDRDEFIVSGDVIFGATAMIDLILGFEPMDILNIEDFFSGFTVFQVNNNFNPLTNIDVMFTANSGITGGSIVNIGLGGEMFALTAAGGAASVAEPGTFALLGFGLGGILLARRRRKVVV